jgi:ribonuclease Z
MGLEFEILGKPGDDNALLVRLNTGQATHRLLFDCGEACVSPLEFAEVLQIDHLCFSHLHMDHVAGFDSYFRANFQRAINHIWGPPETARIMQHRMRGYIWNLNTSMNGSWQVHDVLEDRVATSRFELGEAFEVQHAEGERTRTQLLLEHPDYTLEVLTMNHGTPSLAYIVRESPRSNVDLSKLAKLELKPGPWVKHLKDSGFQESSLEIDGVNHDLNALRSELIVTTPGESIAYLTDFLLDEKASSKLEPALRGVRTLVCESQYQQADLELANKNFHMTSTQAAQLAARVGAQELILFHISDRYEREGWLELLREARAIFPNTHFAESRNLEPA